MAERFDSLLRRVHRRKHRRLIFERLEDRQLLAVSTFSPVADTYTRAGVNAGTAQVLDALDANGPGDRMAYVRFDLSGVDLSSIVSATLTLVKLPGSRNDSITTDRFDTYGLTNFAGNTPQNWNEATLAEGNLGTEYTSTGGNALAFGQLYNLNQETGANVSESVNNTDGAPQTLSGAALIAFLQDRVNDNGLVTFITYVDAGNNRGWGYGARENSTVGFRPTLQVDDGEPPAEPYPENPVVFTRQMEYLNRGIVAVRSSGSDVYVGWRLLGDDPANIAFNLYRSANNGSPVKLNALPLVQSTDFIDSTATASATNTYFVRPVVGDVEQTPSESFTLAPLSPVQQYLSVPLQLPPGGTTPDSVNYTYNANDASVGDLDGDGDYEIILKWDPTNSKDNSQVGYTGNVYVDAYKMDGTRMWRIDLGINIRAGAHYTQFLVYDFDGDGRAEVVMKTAPGTKDGQGNDVLLPGDNPSADYRNAQGRILTGPEYLTVFDGRTGAALATIPFVAPRGSVSSWGDSDGNRVDRFLAAVAYLDGVRPSIVMTRGYYAKSTLTAYDWRDGQLTQRWAFDSTTPGNGSYSGQGNHNLSVADVDGDGKDEIIYGAMVIDDNGQGLYSTGLGHGDALHVTDMDPANPGLEVWQIHESSGVPGADYRDAQNGFAFFSTAINVGEGPARGVAADILAGNAGYEFWGAGGLRDLEGNNIGATPSSANFLVWWDADPLRELLDGQSNGSGAPRIDKYSLAGETRLLTMTGALTNNGTKATPALSADILGDWREEVIVRSSDNQSLRIYTTTIASATRIPTLMHDRKYRLDIAWQNGGYNQPPHPSYFLGDGMAAPPTPQIYTVQFSTGLPGDYNNDYSVDAADYTVWRNNFGALGDSVLNLNGDGTPGVGEGDYDWWRQHYGMVAEPDGGGGGLASAALTATDSESASTSHVGSADELQPLGIPTFATVDSTSAPRHATLSSHAARPVAYRSSDILLVALDGGADDDVAETLSLERAIGPESDDTSESSWDAALEAFDPRPRAIDGLTF